MLEQEIKLYIPASQVEKLKEDLVSETSLQVALQAIYFDTDRKALAEQRSALRIRNENGQWVQTFKTIADDGFSNIEINHNLNEPYLDMGLYKGPDYHPILAGLTEPLKEQYRTDIQRSAMLVKFNESEIEMALDLGQIISEPFHMPVSELELELKTGTLDDLMVLCLHWIEKYQLKIDFRHKAQRGAILNQLRLSTATATITAETEPSSPEGAWPSLIEQHLALRAQSAKTNEQFLTDQKENKQPNSIFEKYLGDLKPIQLLQLLGSEIASLAELEDQAIADVDKNYRLYLILQLSILLDKHLGTDSNESNQGLSALLDSFLPQLPTEQNSATNAGLNRITALTHLFNATSSHGELLSKIKNALYSAPFQMDLTTKLAKLLRT